MEADRTPWASRRYLVVEHTLGEPHGYWWAFDDGQQAWSWAVDRARTLTAQGVPAQQQRDGAGACRWTAQAPDGRVRAVEWHDRAATGDRPPDPQPETQPPERPPSGDPEVAAQILADLALSLVMEQAEDDRVITMAELAAEGDVGAVTRARDQLWRQAQTPDATAPAAGRAAQLLDQVRRRMPSGS